MLSPSYTRSSLIFFVVLTVFGCRAIKKSSASESRSETTNEQSAAKWEREIVTEYLHDTIHKLITVPGETRVIQVEKPLIIRQTVKEKGEASESKAQAVKEEKEESSKETYFPKTIQISILLFAGAILLIAVALLIKQFK